MRGVLRKLWSSDTGSRYKRNIRIRDTSDSQSGTPLPRLYARADPPHPRQSKAAPPRGAGPANALARLSRSTYIYPPQLLHSQPTNPTPIHPPSIQNSSTSPDFFQLCQLEKWPLTHVFPKSPLPPANSSAYIPPSSLPPLGITRTSPHGPECRM